MKRDIPIGEVTALATLQFHEGGFLDSECVDGVIHLLRVTKSGTPGDCLCGARRFISTGPGWSVNGGIYRPGEPWPACGDCVEVADRDFPGLPLMSGTHSKSFPDRTEAANGA